MTSFVDIFEAQRDRLIGLAYRLTGSVFDAEDVAHETYLKWAAADHAQIRDPRAWLVRVATRKALDHLKSAGVQRVTYKGPWLPEPLIRDAETPEGEYDVEQSVTLALMLVLDRLAPAERAAYILHDIFHFNFEEIGGMLDKNAAACRKLASRAREKVAHETPPSRASRKQHGKVVAAFFAAVRDGDIEGLTRVLSEAVVFHADGGGKASAALKILSGREAVIRFLYRAVRPSLAKADADELVIKTTWFNGSPGRVVWQAGQPVSAFSFEIEGGAVKKIYVLRNPDKLRLFRSPPGGS